MRRMRRVVLAAGLVPLGAVGCVYQKDGGGWAVNKPAVPGLTAAATPGTPAAPADLPEKQQAGLCLAMAEECAKKGADADAVLYYEQARALDPGVGERASRRLAVLYDRLDNQAQALKEFDELVKKKPKDAGLLNDLGYSYYNRGQWAEAEAYLRRAVAADKANKQAWNNLGFALAQQGKYAEGLEAFHKAVTPAEAQANLGFVLAVQGKPVEAAQAYRRALELEPTLKTAQAALARLEGAAVPAVESTGAIGPVGSR